MHQPEEYPSQQRFAGRVALVTGGAAGIGHATAKAFARESASVVIVDIDESKLSSTAAELGVEGLRADLRREADVLEMVQTVIERYGQIDILVNLAGIYPFTATEEETLEGWKRVLEVNLDGTFLCCKHVVPHMRSRGYGRIVNTSSGTVNIGVAGLAAYTTTKAGVLGLTRVLSREFGPHGITVNAMMPGLIGTQHALSMFDDRPDAAAAIDSFFADAIGRQSVKRRGEPEDIAHGILFLCEESSSFINGQTLQVDGGYSFT